MGRLVGRQRGQGGLSAGPGGGGGGAVLAPGIPGSPSAWDQWKVVCGLRGAYVCSLGHTCFAG